MKPGWNDYSVSRRKFLSTATLAACGLSASSALPYFDLAKPGATPEKADITLKIAPVSFEIAPKKILHTIGYNGPLSGPALRMTDGLQVVVYVYNHTAHTD